MAFIWAFQVLSGELGFKDVGCFKSTNEKSLLSVSRYVRNTTLVMIAYNPCYSWRRFRGNSDGNYLACG